MVCVPYCVHTGERGVIESCGRFQKIADPGCGCVVCCVQNVAGRVSLRVQHAQIRVETKTKDNVFVWLSVSTMYEVLEDSVGQAFYSLSDPKRQIESFVFNSIRGQIPDYTLDEAFRLRTEIAKALKADLDEQMKRYGYVIIDALITDFDPDSKVKDAMNQINTNARLRIAAENRSEAEKILTVKAAEAEAEAQRLSGEGVAGQRRAILSGLQQSINQFRQDVKGTTSSDVMTLLLLNQYFDTLKDVVHKGESKVIFTPGQESSMLSAVRDGLFQSNALG